VLTADDLRRNLNGQHELVLTQKTIVTPLAAEHLRARGIPVRRLEGSGLEDKVSGGTWGYAMDQSQPLVTSALQALEREGLRLKALPPSTDKQPGSWSRSVAEGIVSGEYRGGIVFCADAGLVCCVANKVKGVRAAPVLNVQQAARALLTLGANLLAVEMPGPTFFEIRQIVRCLVKPSVCPDGVACVLQELDGHAHR
jgi:ribose 5-phosphate isomerase RpiB